MNSTRSNSEEIDVMIGADYYWSMMSEDIIRLNERLVLINSKLGYILSGPVHCNAGKNDAVKGIGQNLNSLSYFPILLPCLSSF